MNAPAAADPGDAIPRLAPRVEVVQLSTGAVRLRGPRLERNRLWRWLARPLGLPQHIEVELDEIGTWVVERFDGRSLRRLVEELSAELRLTRREAQVATADFIAMLLQRRLVELQERPG